MKALLLKEFLLLRMYKVWFIMLIAVFGLFGIFVPYASLFIPLFLSTAMCGNTNNDEKSKWTVYSQSLPFERKEYVYAKYISAFIMALAGVVIIVVTALISSLFRNQLFDIELLFFLCAVSVGISLVPLSIYLPFSYRFNSQVGGIVLVIVYFGAMMFLPVVFLTCIMSELLGVVHSISTSLIAMAVIIAVFLLSWFISVKIYEKRDL